MRGQMSTMYNQIIYYNGPIVYISIVCRMYQIAFADVWWKNIIFQWTERAMCLPNARSPLEFMTSSGACATIHLAADLWKTDFKRIACIRALLTSNTNFLHSFPNINGRIIWSVLQLRAKSTKKLLLTQMSLICKKSKAPLPVPLKMTKVPQTAFKNCCWWV